MYQIMYIEAVTSTIPSLLKFNCDETKVTAGKNAKTRFVPFATVDIIEMCIDRGELSKSEIQGFREVCRMLHSIFHFEFHDKLEALKNAYRPINPNTQTISYRPQTKNETDQSMAQFVERLSSILVDANYEKIDRTDLNAALEQASLFSLKLQIEFNDFDDYVLFRRGLSKKTEKVRPWYSLKTKELQFDSYDRVVLYVRFKDEQYFEHQGKEKPLFKPGSAMLKMFQNVPVHDIEMLFPNTQVRMRTIDKLLIGIPATVGGLLVLVTKLGASIALIASLILFWMGFTEHSPGELDQKQLLTLAGGLAALGGFLFRQWGKFKNRRIGFLKTLTENLYFRNLDNNMGVIFRLINSAEEEETKEALLAYYFLLAHPQGTSESAIDEAIEQWFANEFNCEVDFEVDDALQKLDRLGLLKTQGETIRCVEIDQAKIILDQIWDNYFQYN